MKVVPMLYLRSVLKTVVCTAIVGFSVSAIAQSAEKETPFQKSKYPKIQVRHVPMAASDKARQIPAAGTPRSELPVLKPATAKGGKLLRLDNTYLVHCPPPTAKATNAPAESKAP